MGKCAAMNDIVCSNQSQEGFTNNGYCKDERSCTECSMLTAQPLKAKQTSFRQDRPQIHQVSTLQDVYVGGSHKCWAFAHEH
jgi:hypothetical protein